MPKRVLGLAIPNIISNITIPLVGMVDLAIAGRLPGDSVLGGIAIGGAIFNMIYWNFGFLRMGTSGFTAQAYGRRDFQEVTRILARGLMVALAIAAALIVLQIPIEKAILGWVMDGSPEVERLAADYFYVRIWAAPATLGLYAFKGWYIGMQNARTPMWIAIVINIVNIVASLLLAFSFGMGLRGVALGTVLAQWSGFLMAALILMIYYRKILSRAALIGAFHAKAMLSFFRVNGDIFIRTLCLVAVFTFFTSASSTMGDQTLAANTLMMQLFTLFSYMMDGFAYSGEALCGRYYGAGNIPMLKSAVRSVFGWGALVAMSFTALYLFFGEWILMLFTDNSAILDIARGYLGWAVAIPIVSFAAFLMDGILVGVTHTAIMRNAMILATIAFFALYFALGDSIGNNAIWLAFLVYLALRGALQWWLYHGKLKGVN